MPPSVDPTCPHPKTDRSPNASRTPRAGPSTSSSPTPRRSTSPAATWPSANVASRRSAASTRSSGLQATTWTSAGVCRKRAGRWGSARQRWSGITAAIQWSPTGSSRPGTAGPRRCSSASGLRSTTVPATSGGPGGSGQPAERLALSDADLSVEQTLGVAGVTAPFPSRGAAGGGSLRPPRRRARPLGPRGPQRSARRGPAAHGGRRRSRRAAHPTAALAARCSGRAAPGRVVRGAHRRRPRRSRLARGGDPRPVLVSRRTAHDRAGHVVDGRPLACVAAALRREALMGNVALYRKLLRQTLPYWAGIAGLFALGLLASAVALLNPVPLKLVVDSVLGTRPP